MQTVQVVLLAKQLAYMLKENILPGISLQTAANQP